MGTLIPLIKSSGYIGSELSDGAWLFPHFFVGCTLPRGTLARFSRNENEIEKTLRLNETKPGQFLAWHQYAGHYCSTIDLFGIFIPVWTCKNPALLRGLTKIANDWGQNVYHHWSQFEQIEKQWSAQGPFHLVDKPSERDFEEAFVRFGSTPDILPFLIENGFEYIVEIRPKTVEEDRAGRERGKMRLPKLEEKQIQSLLRHQYKGQAVPAMPPEQQRRYAEQMWLRRYYEHHSIDETETLDHLFSTKPLEWRDQESFADWINGKHLVRNHSIHSWNISAAFLYENSD